MSHIINSALYIQASFAPVCYLAIATAIFGDYYYSVARANIEWKRPGSEGGSV